MKRGVSRLASSMASVGKFEVNSSSKMYFNLGMHGCEIGIWMDKRSTCCTIMNENVKKKNEGKSLVEDLWYSKRILVNR